MPLELTHNNWITTDNRWRWAAAAKLSNSVNRRIHRIHTKYNIFSSCRSIFVVDSEIVCKSLQIQPAAVQSRLMSRCRWCSWSQCTSASKINFFNIKKMKKNQRKAHRRIQQFALITLTWLEFVPDHTSNRIWQLIWFHVCKLTKQNQIF
jgi:hypothetical protein